jgi:hypothetical protein
LAKRSKRHSVTLTKQIRKLLLQWFRQENKPKANFNNGVADFNVVILFYSRD